MMIRKLFSRIAMLSVCSLPLAAFADVVVIVHPSVSASGTQAEAADLFLGKASALGGVTLTPVDQESGSASRNTFYEKAAGKNPSQLNAHWSRIVFTGKGQPPKAVGDDSQVKEAVAKDKSLIGYIDSSALDSSVKKIITVK
jgi:ABC-type phosphate transport system substrate-binding protein